MAETEEITVADVSDGPGNDGEPGVPVSLPVVELLTGRGFITGKSGSGKSNSASVIAEKLLDNGFGLFIVDIDGEYYGLKEEYEILHVGADEECDIQVGEDHAEKLATLALEQNVPIILDVSSFLDEAEAEAVLTAVARHLFAKAKKQKQPFLLLVEEVHEYIPEGGSVGECGKMLIKIGKRGRKHGLGIVGISQRPADVKKDFITQCDWLLWHRLTWDNDTNVVRRVLDGEYATAVEDLDDGEGFLTTDWSESVRRVQFHRKQTFDAGATPGLEDVERPDLKSVSGDLVEELEEISEEKQAREDRIAELREELDRKNSRIAELEAELKDARDLSRMADQFVDALVQHVDGPQPGRTERERMRERTDASAGASPDAVEPDAGTETDSEAVEASEPAEEAAPGGADDGAFAAAMEAVTETPGDDGAGDGSTATASGGTPSERANGTAGTDSEGGDREFSAEAVLSALRDVESEMSTGSGRHSVGDHSGTAAASDGSGRADGASSSRLASVDDDGHAEIVGGEAAGEERESGPSVNGGGDGSTDGTSGSDDEAVDDEAVYGGGDDESSTGVDDEEPLAVRELKADVAGFETLTREMLSFYAEEGPGTPLDAHLAAGGDGDRKRAYAHNRRLRTRGLVEHVGRGHYDYCLRDLLEEELDGASRADLEVYAKRIEETALD